MVVIWLNLIGASAARWVNLYACWHWRHTRAAVMYGALMMLSWFYACGYVYLLNTGDTAGWSNFYRSVSLVVWPLVWMMPSFVATSVRRKELRSLARSTQVAKEHLRLRQAEGKAL